MSGDDEFCAVHLINEGVAVEGGTASMFFQGTEAVISFMCRLRLINELDTGYQPCE